MHVATTKQVERLIENGDIDVALKAAAAAVEIKGIFELWGSMDSAMVKQAADSLRALADRIEGKPQGILGEILESFE